MNYGEILSSAWKTIWKYKVLWIFGILAALGGGGGGSAGGGNSNFNGNNQSFPFGGDRIGAWLENNWWVLLVAAVLIFLAIIVLVVLSTYGRIGLARGAWKADQGAPRLSFGMLFAESGRYFWRVLGLALLIFVASLAFALIVGLGTAGVALLTFGIGLICMIPLLCVLVVAGWGVEILIRLTVIAIVGEDKGVFEALQAAWNTLRTHLADSLVLGLILGIGGWIVRLVISAPFALTLIPLFPAFFSQTDQAMQRGMIGAAVIACCYLPVAVFLGGVLEAYVGSAWTLAYRRMSGQPRAAGEIVEPGA